MLCWGVGSASKAGPVASGSLATALGAVEPSGPAAAGMETEVSDASNPYSVEGESLLLDLDLYDVDSYDILDPGLLKEKNGEVAWRRPPDTHMTAGMPCSGRRSVCCDTTLPGQALNPAGPGREGLPPASSLQPPASRLRGPRPHSDCASTADLQSCFRTRSRGFLPAARGGRT